MTSRWSIARTQVFWYLSRAPFTKLFCHGFFIRISNIYSVILYSKEYTYFLFFFLKEQLQTWDMTLKQLHNQVSTRVSSPFAKMVGGIIVISVCQQIWLPTAFTQLKIVNLRCQNINQEPQKSSSPLSFGQVTYIYFLISCWNWKS